MQATTLRTALLSNALFSTLSGLTFMFFGHSVAELTGIGDSIIYQVIGVGLLGFAGCVAWTGTRKLINTFLAALISLADFAWVIGTCLLIVLGSGSMRSEGIAILLVIAAIVLLFGLRQLQGINRMYAVPDKPHTSMLCIEVNTPVASGEIWPVIADLPGIYLYSPNLTQVILRGDAESGAGAVRQCTDVNGRTWGEYCRQYDEQARRIEFEFLADEPGFPYPFKTMIGGWDVEPDRTGSTVTIWFEVTPKYHLAHPIIMALMARNLADSFGDVVTRMTAAARGDTVTEQISPVRYGVKSVLAACH